MATAGFLVKTYLAGFLRSLFRELAALRESAGNRTKDFPVCFVSECTEGGRLGSVVKMGFPFVRRLLPGKLKP